ncbi:hypothetical protein PG993_000721 [Apiospora rasikravindrae]|uniref:2'-phosphotransferase n=1 Tax=Apiospora rasikravindrae TaxID=990691 RepID=A0ABR1U9E6_9PEZI
MADDGLIDDAAAERFENLALRGGRQGGGGGRGGKRGRRGGGGGGHEPDREVLLSKALSALLRHKASDAGIEMNGEGFARLDQVFQWPRIRSLKPTLAEIQKVERDNAKKRFTLKPVSEADADSTDPKDWLIRANQGHSIELASEALHAPITLEAANVPDVVVHGTYFAFWPAIVESGGLKKMGRTHVHFGTGLPEDGNPTATASGSKEPQVHEAGDEDAAPAKEERGGKPKVISGMRADAEILMFIDVEASLRNGDMKWWLSSNGVVLTEGDENGCVPLKYFKEVRGRRQGGGTTLEGWRKGRRSPRGHHDPDPARQGPSKRWPRRPGQRQRSGPGKVILRSRYGTRFFSS